MLTLELQIVQIAIKAVELGVAIGHLLVDGGQLFVGRLQFFLGGFQFFVDALQLLVGGLDFFVGRLEFLVGRFVLFLDGLQVIAGLGKLGFKSRVMRRDSSSCAGRRRLSVGALRALRCRSRRTARPIFSASSNKIKIAALPQILERNDFHVHRRGPCHSDSTRTFSLRTILFSFFALLMAARSGSIKPSRAIFSTSKLALPVGGSKIGAGRPAELQDLQLGIDQHAGRTRID